MKSRIDFLKDQRDRRNYDGGVQVDGLWFPTTKDARATYTTIVAMGEDEDYVVAPDWRTMEAGVTTTMTPKLAKAIISAAIQNQVDLDKNYRRLLAKVEEEPFNPMDGWTKAFWERESR